MARHLILVVDDEDNLRDVLVEVLKRDGHEVDSAVDGAEGLRRAEERRYDLVVTDLRMPGLEGPELYRALRERYPDRPPRVIFMSANTGIDEYTTFLAETGEPALEKPFNLTDMRQVVLQVLTQVRRAARTEQAPRGSGGPGRSSRPPPRGGRAGGVRPPHGAPARRRAGSGLRRRFGAALRRAGRGGGPAGGGNGRGRGPGHGGGRGGARPPRRGHRPHRVPP